MKRYTPVHTQQVQCVGVVEIAAFAYLYYPCSYDKCPESIHLIAHADFLCSTSAITVALPGGTELL